MLRRLEDARASHPLNDLHHDDDRLESLADLHGQAIACVNDAGRQLHDLWAQQGELLARSPPPKWRAIAGIGPKPAIPGIWAETILPRIGHPAGFGGPATHGTPENQSIRGPGSGPVPVARCCKRVRQGESSEPRPVAGAPRHWITKLSPVPIV